MHAHPFQLPKNCLQSLRLHQSLAAGKGHAPLRPPEIPVLDQNFYQFLRSESFSVYAADAVLLITLRGKTQIFRVGTPGTVQAAPFGKNRRPDTRPVMKAHTLDIGNHQRLSTAIFYLCTGVRIFPYAPHGPQHDRTISFRKKACVCIQIRKKPVLFPTGNTITIFIHINLRKNRDSYIFYMAAHPQRHCRIYIVPGSRRHSPQNIPLFCQANFRQRIILFFLSCGLTELLFKLFRRTAALLQRYPDLIPRPAFLNDSEYPEQIKPGVQSISAGIFIPEFDDNRPFFPDSPHQRRLPGADR